MKEITITKREAGQRLDRFLGKYLPNASASFLYKMLRKKNIKWNGQKAQGRERLEEGDQIQIFFSPETLEQFRGNPGSAKTGDANGKENNAPNERKMPMARRHCLTREQKKLREQVKVLYRSDDLVIFHKPAGMLSQKAEKTDDSLNDYLIDYCLKERILCPEELESFHPSIANRLDRNTSGIVLAGITVRGLQSLSSFLKKRELEKYYLCLAAGKVKKDAHISGYLKKEEKKNQVQLFAQPVKGASLIETEYRVIQSNEKASLLKIRLITGKSHQIRGHLASIGHPVLGDYKYGRRNANDPIKWSTGVNYQLLHSYELILPETEGQKGLHIIDPVPPDFCAVQKYLGLECPGRDRVFDGKEKTGGND